MKYTKFIVVVVLTLAMSSCSLFTRKHNSGAAVEVNGNFLSMEELNEVTRGLSGEDSASVADAFIRQWATEILIYDRARNRVGGKELDMLVEDYRRSLYTHEYEQYLLNRMPKEVPDALVDSFYQAHANMYVLKEGIVRGLLVIVPQGAPDLEKLKKSMVVINEKTIEAIEKYAYRYASGYELFTDEWKTNNQLLLWLPLEKNDLQKQLKQDRQIVLTDSVSTYILQVTDIRQAGEPMPIEYARADIEAILLRERAINYISEERKRIYEDAVRFKKVRFYESK